jgi:hypothetical protein
VALQSQLQTQHRGAMSKEEGIRRGSVVISSKWQFRKKAGRNDSSIQKIHENPYFSPTSH